MILTVLHSENYMIYLENKISEAASKFCMEINQTKTKLMLNDNTSMLLKILLNTVQIFLL